MLGTISSTGMPRRKFTKYFSQRHCYGIVCLDSTFVITIEMTVVAQATVQPRVTEQVVACSDPIAQQYLVDVLVQGFPDDFHLGTLGALLGCLPQLSPGVKVHLVLASLLDRLARYSTIAPPAS